MKSYYVYTIAGKFGTSGYADGKGSAANFTSPTGISVDKDGYIYVSDDANTIRKISQDGTVVTLAGSREGGNYNSTDPLKSRFSQPGGVSLDSENNLYVADFENSSIRKISKNGVENVGIGYTFSYPVDCAVDTQGNVYITDRDHSAIAKIDKNGDTSVICTISQPYGIGVSPTGVVYVTNLSGLCMIEDGTVHVLVSHLKELFGVAVDEHYIYVCENHSIKRYSFTTKELELVAGTEIQGCKDGPGDVAQFGRPWGIAIDKHGCLYVAERANHTIRKIVPTVQMSADWPATHLGLPPVFRDFVEFMTLILMELDQIPKDLKVPITRAIIIELFRTQFNTL